MAEEQQPPLQFATIQQVTILPDQMSTITEMLQRMTALPPISKIPLAAEVPPVAEAPPTAEVLLAVKILPSKTIQTLEMTSTIRHSIPVNWEIILNEKVDEVIA
ncbi:hypothetical protein Fot_12448 [Forsythia ovata]|uniref:Uncharacterized protein n=1 Tax=Forsythia ovata TaxID=205694 RepID=A0ABD1WMJ5_9LAMI